MNIPVICVQVAVCAAVPTADFVLGMHTTVFVFVVLAPFEAKNNGRKVLFCNLTSIPKPWVVALDCRQFDRWFGR